MDLKKNKFTVSTDTDLHLNYLADPGKVVVIPNRDDNDSLSSDTSLSTSSDSDTTTTTTNIKVEDHVRNMIKPEKKDNTNTATSWFGKAFGGGKPANETKPVPNGVDKTRMYMEQSKELPFDQLPVKVQKFKKLEKFAKLMHLKNNCGVKLTQEYNLNSKYEDMEFELQYHTSIANKKKGIELWKGFITNGVTAMEFMNERFDPFGFKLGGWSEHVKVGIDDYDEVLGELYEKYKGKGKKVEPEIKLMIMLVTSAATFHASKSLGDTIPGLDEVLKNNPELIHKLNRTIAGSKKTENDVVNEVNNYQRDLYDQMLREKRSAQDEINNNEIENMKLRAENNNQKRRIDELHKQNVNVNVNQSNNQQQRTSGPSNLGDIIKKMKEGNRRNDKKSSRLSFYETLSSNSSNSDRRKRRTKNIISIAT
jgi:hypothetical protein